MDRVNYYSVLDTVLFRPDQRKQTLDERRVVATGAPMLDLLIGNVTPLLSQTQAFDSPLLLGQLVRTDADAAALRGLVRTGRIQVRIFDSPSLRQPPGGGNRFTLVNAFCSALANPSFLLSAWPELSDRTLRHAVAEQLSAAPERLHELGDAELVDRLEALRELDAALQASAVSERAQPSSSVTLLDLVTSSLPHLAEPNRPARSADSGVRWLLERAHSPGRPPVTTRSDWYHLLHALLDVDPGYGEIADQVRGLVDGAYNQVVAASLGATGSLTECSDESVADALGSAGGSPGALAAELLHDPRRAEWLTWSRLEALLQELADVPNPRRRAERLLTEHAELVARTEVHGKAGLALLVAAPSASLTTAAGIVGSVVGTAAGGLTGAALGGLVTGAVALLSALPVTARIQERLAARTERRRSGRYLALGQSKPTVTTGTASWQANLQE